MTAESIVRFMSRMAFVLLLCFTVGVRPGIAAADLSKASKFDIRPQRLPSALLKYSEESGVQVTSPGTLVEGKNSPGVVGTFEAKEALERLLKGTALGYAIIDNNTVLITQPASAATNATAADGSQGKSASNEETAQNGKAERSFQGRFRVAQVDQGATPGPAAVEGAEGTDVIVSARKMEQTLPQELSQYGSRVTVIDAQDIERRGITDIAQALQVMAPSLYIQARAGAFDYVDVSLQGSRTSEVLWLVDGVRVTNRLYNTNTPLDTMPASMIERIEVLEGGQGLFYGTQAVAGVINIITKSFSRDTNGQVALGLDSNDGRHASGYVRGSSGSQQYVLYASGDNAGGFQPVPTSDYQPSATHRTRRYDVQTLGVKYGVDLGERLRLSAGFQFTHAPQLDAVLATKINEYYNERKEGLGNIKLDWDIADNFGLYVKAYDHKWDSYVTRVENSLVNPGTQIQVARNAFWGYKDYGLNALAKYVPHRGGLEYYFGYDYQNYGGEDTFLLIDKKIETVHAGFFQIRSGSLFQKLKLAAGARYNHPKDGKQLTVWNFSANYALNDYLFLRTNLGTAYRLPDADELYAKDPCCTRGNSRLAGEKSKNLNFSIGGEFPMASRAVSWELIGFVRDVDNLITGVDNGFGILISQNSNQTSKVRGGTATVQAPLGAAFDARLSYTKTRAILGVTGLQIDRIPEHVASAVLNYRSEALPVGGTISVNNRGDMYQSLSGGLGRRDLGRSTTADISTYVEFGDRWRQRVIASVQNISNEMSITREQREFTDATHASYPVRILGLPRTYTLAYNFNF